jgi:hypothetical protein
MAYAPNHMGMSGFQGMTTSYVAAPNQLQAQSMINPYSYYQPGSYVQPGFYNPSWNTPMGLQQGSIYNPSNLNTAPAPGLSANFSSIPNKSLNSNKKELG